MRFLVARFCREVEVDGIAGCNLEVVKAVEAAVAPDRICANVRKGSTHIHSRIRPATDFNGIGRCLHPGRNAKRRHNSRRQGVLDRRKIKPAKPPALPVFLTSGKVPGAFIHGASPLMR